MIFPPPFTEHTLSAHSICSTCRTDRSQSTNSLSLSRSHQYRPSKSRGNLTQDDAGRRKTLLGPHGAAEPVWVGKPKRPIIAFSRRLPWSGSIRVGPIGIDAGCYWLSPSWRAPPDQEKKSWDDPITRIPTASALRTPLQQADRALVCRHERFCRLDEYPYSKFDVVIIDAGAIDPRLPILPV